MELAVAIVHLIGSAILAVSLIWAVRIIQQLAAEVRRDVASLKGNAQMRHGLTAASKTPTEPITGNSRYGKPWMGDAVSAYPPELVENRDHWYPDKPGQIPTDTTYPVGTAWERHDDPTAN